MRSVSRAVLVVVALAQVPGCGSSSGPSSPAAPPDYSGTWAGRTDHAETLEFVVAGAQVTSATLSGVGVSVPGPGINGFCGEGCRGFTFTSVETAPVAGGSFRLRLQAINAVTGAPYPMSLEGHFSGSTSAGGTVEPFEMPGLCCRCGITGPGPQQTACGTARVSTMTWQASKAR